MKEREGAHLLYKGGAQQNMCPVGHKRGHKEGHICFLQLILDNINNTKFNSTGLGQENWNYSGWVLLSVQIYFHCMHNIAETNYLKWQLSGGGKCGHKQYLA